MGKQHGQVSERTGRVAIEVTPGTFTMCGRHPKDDFVLGDGTVSFTSFGTGLQMFDLETGEVRDTDTEDLENFARFCDAIPEINAFTTAVAAQDAPGPLKDFYEAEAIFKIRRNTPFSMQRTVTTPRRLSIWVLPLQAACRSCRNALSLLCACAPIVPWKFTTALPRSLLRRQRQACPSAFCPWAWQAERHLPH